MPEDWHPSDIKAGLEKRGTNLSELSRISGLRSRTLGNALRVIVLHGSWKNEALPC
ncbi:helix-turn-helix domain-containing protein [Enterobacter asburiae]